MEEKKYKSLHIRPKYYDKLKKLAEEFNAKNGTESVTPAEMVGILIKEHEEKK